MVADGIHGEVKGTGNFLVAFTGAVKVCNYLAALRERDALSPHKYDEGFQRG